ncbi:MAG TPA: type VI secretion system baseplate subunit TssF, partial [Telluria sp.]|nr:type VI secretion system baseplate subunit TssF [Telluria sp.]
MTDSLADLLRRYERERLEQRTGGYAFAQRFPAEAAALGLTTGGAAHPHTQALLDALSFANARTREQLDRNLEQFARDLLSALFPFAVRPLPPYSIVQFAGAPRPGATGVVPRGTALFASHGGGTRCQFRTCYDTELTPLSLAAAAFSRDVQAPPGVFAGAQVQALLSIAFTCPIPLQDLAADHVRVFIDADRLQASALRDALFLRACAACTEDGTGHWRVLPGMPIRSIGFGPGETILPPEARTPPANQALLEYFAYPEKFNFFDLDLDMIRRQLPAGSHGFQLHLGLHLNHGEGALERVLAPLSAANLRLGCTPVVNLFAASACPVYRDYTKSDYVLLPNALRPADYEIYSVDAVTSVAKSAARIRTTQFHPYHSLKHGQAGSARPSYWLMRRDERMADIRPGFETSIAFIDAEFDPLGADASVMSVDLTCSNRDLATTLAIGARDGDLRMASGQAAGPVRLLRHPSPTRRLPAREQWRLVSHLAVNLNSLLQPDLDALKELLTLHDSVRVAASQSQIGGLAAIAWDDCILPYR